MTRRLFLSAAALALLGAGSLKAGTTITVTNTNESGQGSLRNALIASNALGGANTINFAPGVAGTITLQTGQLDITTDTTIIGPGARILTIDGNKKQRVFRIPNAANVNISGLTITNGAVADTGAGIQALAGQLTLTNCAITNNVATNASGGGVVGSGGTTLTLSGCTVSGNQSTNESGGGIVCGKGTLTVTNCTIANNTAFYTGGGIYVFENAGPVNVSNSTIAANHLTVTTNQAAGGGIYYFTNVPTTFTLTNCIVADNTNLRADNQSKDVFADPGLISGGYNLITTTSGLNANFAKSTDKLNVAAHLGGLHNNGGPTDTIMPASSSPAVDNGNSFGLTTDQRGFQRPYDQPGFTNAADGSDIGAVEVQATQPPPNFTVTTTAEQSLGFCEVVNCSLWDAATAADNNSANNSVITFASGVTGTINVTIQPAGMFLTKSMTIVGPGARSLTLNGGGVSRIFSVSGQNVVISGLRLTGGLTHGGTGGAITNDGGLTLNDCQLDNNSALASSQAAPNGGAIQSNSNASLTVNRCTFYANTAAVFGGGINSAGILTATNCTFFRNLAEGGGGVDNFGGTATLINCSVIDNAAVGGTSGDEGAGLRNQGGSFTITNTIVANNIADDNKTIDLDGPFISGGGNVIDRIDGATSFTGGDPNYPDKKGTNLKRLDAGVADYGDHGGPTDTVALAAGSVAIDSANPSKAPATDQRGFSRAGPPDVGAFEFGGTAPTPTPTPTPTPAPTATPTPTATSTATPPSQLLNLSTRKQVGTGDNVLIGGFIVAGTDAKKVLLRGLGPSLPVSGALQDPILELHDSTTATLAVNDNWRDAPNASEIAAILPPVSDLESAIMTTLAGKPASQGGAGYTGVLAGKGGTTGIGLLEIYDLNTAANSTLANISTRGFVGVDPDLLIGGFIPGPDGRAPMRVLLRALGPSLANQGVNGALADPLLELHDGNGATLVTNDNWHDATNASEIASILPPPDDRESAILSTVPPVTSGYTAVVRGANGTTGVALVEVYALQ